MTAPTRSGIDLERLRRAVFLDAERLPGSRRYSIRGGERDHVVDLDGEFAPSCDCLDHQERLAGVGACKHILRALLAEGDRDVLAGLRALVTPGVP